MQLEIIFAGSPLKADGQEPERQRLGLVRKPNMLQGPGGRIIGTAMRTKAEMLEDFWKRIKIGGLDECWEWQRGKQENKKGLDYGIVWMGGRKWKSHRMACELVRGPIPAGFDVCHTCDNPPCCNPIHLFPGTAKDNIQDCIRKGRYKKEMGEDRYNAVLTERNVLDIRRRYRKRSFTSGGRALAKEFGVGATMIYAIVKGYRWKHLLPGANTIENANKTTSK